MSRKFYALSLALLLTACAQMPRSTDKADADDHADEGGMTAVASDGLFLGGFWQHKPLPGKQATEYVQAYLDGREVVAVQADASASMLRQTLRIEAQDLGRVQFSWKVPELIAQADLGQRELDDSPVRLVLAFEGDRSRFSLKNSMLSDLAQVLTGEPMPYATLMYVWCKQREPESVVHSPRTDRIRKLVVESGEKNLKQWRDYERDIRADFIQAFGEAPGALVGVALMTDTDNTRSSARAWYGPVQLGKSVQAKN